MVQAREELARVRQVISSGIGLVSTAGIASRDIVSAAL